MLLGFQLPLHDVTMTSDLEQSHRESPTHHLLSLLTWPVGVAALLQFMTHTHVKSHCPYVASTDLAVFFQLTQHHNTATLVLPHHPPEVLHCTLQWTLSHYVGISLLVTLNVLMYVEANVERKQLH